MIIETGCQTRRMESADTKTIEVIVNGEPRRVPEGFFLDRLLVWLEIDPSRVAVERNRAIARKTDWPATRIEPGDQLEIVWFVGGG
ncbi:MAG: thiamine biosynthesis protein ThiS [Bryobacterales bacterium]|nr:thiamine biosynthesis protein ThiS [Bryobacterales bacterium]